jgi:hypothetical protein
MHIIVPLVIHRQRATPEIRPGLGLNPSEPRGNELLLDVPRVLHMGTLSVSWLNRENIFSSHPGDLPKQKAAVGVQFLERCHREDHVERIVVQLLDGHLRRSDVDWNVGERGIRSSQPPNRVPGNLHAAQAGEACLPEVIKVAPEIAADFEDTVIGSYIRRKAVDHGLTARRPHGSVWVVLADWLLLEQELVQLRARNDLPSARSPQHPGSKIGRYTDLRTPPQQEIAEQV